MQKPKLPKFLIPTTGAVLLALSSIATVAAQENEDRSAGQNEDRSAGQNEDRSAGQN